MIEVSRVCSAALALVAILLCAEASNADPNLDAFLDGVLAAERQNTPFAGAVVAVVQDGRLLSLRGHGMADIGAGIRVNPRETLFRVGSLSKVFVWLRLHQLIEDGALSLNTDVRDLIEIPVALAFNEPLTVRHLMTHRSGFEDRVIPLFAQGQRTAGSLADALVDLAPRQVARPGTVSAYSNYATALAALVIESVANEPWQQSIERSVLRAAGARSASYAQPLPAELQGLVATGYRRKGEQLLPMPFEYFRLSPAGSLSASATDMAALMVAMLERGRALSEPARQLAVRDSRNPVELSAATLGLYERPGPGVRAVAHDGSLQFSQARLVLWPSERTGLFVAVNSDSGFDVGKRIERAFAERAGLRRGPGAELAVVSNPLSYVGHYATARRAHSTPAALGALVDWVTIEGASDGNLHVTRPDGSFLAREVAAGVLQEIDGDRRLGLAPNGSIVLSSFPPVEYVAVGEWLRPDRQIALVAASVLALALYVVCLAGSLVGLGAGSAPAGRPFTSLWLLGLALAWMAFLAVFGQQFAAMDALFRGEDETLRQLLWLPPVLAVASLLGFLSVLLGWLQGSWSLRFRLVATAATIASVVLSVWCFYWRLLPAELNALL